MVDPLESMNVSLPRSMTEFIRGRMKAKGFGNKSEYIRSLVREDQRAEARERLESLLRDGLESEPIEVTPRFWDDLRRRVEARVGRQKRLRRAG